MQDRYDVSIRPVMGVIVSDESRAFDLYAGGRQRAIKVWLDSYKSENTRGAYGRDVSYWFSWCDDGFECIRKWWQYSGSCVIDSDYKFLNEGCKVNDNCNHVFTENAKVHLACRFGKCGFADGDVCDEDENIEFADYSELPVIDTNAETGGAWTVSLGVPAIGAAAIFMLRKPERHLKHAKMDENDQVNGRL